MKSNYFFNPKTWLFTGIVIAFTSAFTLNLQAQTFPARQWDRVFGGSQIDAFETIQQTSDGGYILGGSSDSPVSGDKTEASRGAYDYWVVKTNAAGMKIWDKAFGGSNNDYLKELQQTVDGGFILASISSSGAGGDKTEGLRGMEDYWVIKLDANGNKVWDKTLGG